MKIIIAGAGEVGFHLAKLLSYESQEITLIDTKKDSLAYAGEHLDIRTIKGDATSIAILRDARIDKAALFIAVTSSETTNITACVLAKQLGARKTIARISNTEFIDNKETVGFSKFGIDELISPESLAASEIELLLNQYGGFNDTYQFEEGALTMLGLRLSRTATFVDKTVKEAAEIYPELHFIPIAIQRLGTQYTIIPRGDTIFKEGDKVVFMTCEGGDQELFDLSGKVKAEIKDVMILGGSQIGYKTAKDLCDNKFNVKIIESKRNVAEDLAEDLPNALVIFGDGRNVDILEEENISDMDAFIAVTGNSETNIMSCLLAKSKGVRKTIALVENMDYYQLSQSIGIDTLINKKLLAANNIFRYIRKGEVVAMTKLTNMNAELLEFVVKPKSKITNKLIKDLKFPKSAIFGGIIRDGNGLIPLGSFKIEAGDRVVVCCLPRSISEVETFFS
ncbi:trk system potassium uptake protein TrkA [Winogradskyella eximia]|jgi:trk/ktr system potassium uptake protein|uniref:Trk system potassium uptake protein TrkA n=1 Tax=Winogradskyella eximia TaxID=262006 RepID=A0A3D9HCA0_9FLAO|nr:Trk system potassium transporter TrkA [Winogradskyella eximia]RED47098.1 trk system potassium uptake protein TrkA [Winogradskyella eximia]|tara:strand:+ start:640 stop:1992 length:1353 start_codon:yes stop_codon:yes gene_type:complete